LRRHIDERDGIDARVLVHRPRTVMPRESGASSTHQADDISVTRSIGILVSWIARLRGR
jgi:hypothetical protein